MSAPRDTYEKIDDRVQLLSRHHDHVWREIDRASIYTRNDNIRRVVRVWLLWHQFSPSTWI